MKERINKLENNGKIKNSEKKTGEQKQIITKLMGLCVVVV